MLRHDEEMKYHDFDIRLEDATANRFRAFASCPPRGETDDVCCLDPDSGSILEMRNRLTREDTDKSLLSDFGTLLYSALFLGDKQKIERLFAECRGAYVAEGSEGIRVRLRIEPPKLAALPWELLYDRFADRFFATSTETPLVRYTELRKVIRELKVQLPVRMLVVAPEGSGLDARTETANLFQAIKGLEEQIKTKLLDKGVTYTAIRDLLRDEEFHLLHFIGHGEFLNDHPLLVLDDGHGGSESVDHERIGGLFSDHPTMKLVLLNSCKGAQTSSTEPLLGMAAQLVKCGVPAVIAMQYEIEDDQAISFAREFYGTLFKGKDPGRIELAMSQARNCLLHDFPGDRVVGTPVLFSRAADGLFDLRTGNAIKDLPITAAQADTTKAVIRTREENQKILKSAPEQTEAVADALRQESAEIRRLKLRLYLGKAAIIAAFLLAPVVFGLAYIGPFDWLPRGLKMQTYTVWLVDSFFPKSFTDRIALVPMTERTATRFARPLLGANWRGEHAKLVERLSSAGAKVIVFDMFFPKAKEFDEKFSRSIAAAKQRGTSVVVGATNAPEGRPEITPVLAGAVSNWGLLCVGETQDSAEVVPLLVDRPGANREPLQSLALAGVAAYNGWTVTGLDTQTKSIVVKAGTSSPQHVGISGLEQLRKNQKFCGLLAAGDVAANRIIDVTPSRTLKDPKRRLAYEDVVASSTPPDVRGKIVVVGVEDPSEEFELRRGFSSQTRYGYELHADAMNTLFQPLTIRPLASWPQFLIIFLLSLAGGLVWVWQPDRAGLRWAVLVGLGLLYLAVSIWAYGRHRVLLSTVYPLLALLLSYLVVRRFRRSTSPEGATA
jgi:CHASE2 domain-containing sensor protein